jgi:hypothetical protein
MDLRRTNGPLKVCEGNRRYFADASGRAVLMTGSHTWATLQDYDPANPFDFRAMLEKSRAYGHSFIRMWAWEQARWAAHTEEDFRFSPLAYVRTGPGEALDGGPRFDLTKFNDAYFERLRERVQLAGEYGIYVSVMLFQGWSVEFKVWGYGPGIAPWKAHPFNKDNNVNGIDGDPDETGDGLSVHTLAVPAVNEIQRAYVRRVVETVHDLDNVMFEISNESAATPASRDWQYAMTEEIHRHEERLGGYRHPVSISAMWPSDAEVNNWLRAGPNEAMSPSNLLRYVGIGDDFMLDPPPGDGVKVVLADTDHIWGIGGDVDWVWRSFTRGLNPIFMDPWDGDFVVHPPYGPGVRPAMGIVRRISEEIDLTAMVPSGELVSSGFALADADRNTIVAFLPGEGKLGVDLRGLDGQFKCQWQHTYVDSRTDFPALEGGKVHQVASPYVSGGALLLRR